MTKNDREEIERRCRERIQDLRDNPPDNGVDDAFHNMMLNGQEATKSFRESYMNETDLKLRIRDQRTLAWWSLSDRIDYAILHNQDVEAV